ncbi:MAG: hypothetical protein OEM01_07465 [Desulfobulbaceae bacterium]|nr:hypothetical protein [Desulfobulbaceae bacterium]
MHYNRIFPVCICIITVVLPLLLPDSVWGVQQHGGAEGLISHQIGHLLFITGMLVLFYRLRGSSASGAGWLDFKIFIGLIILWNLLTFYGHWHRELISPDKFVLFAGKVNGFSISSPADALFYLSRLDHLLLVPAFLFLLSALYKWRKQA